uniref:Uncharacterized protein n=1 Tax=Glossina morsitans morsitans TaxID=37546 RepID=A0A1B0FLN0_GLOMM
MHSKTTWKRYDYSHNLELRVFIIIGREYTKTGLCESIGSYPITCNAVKLYLRRLYQNFA